MRALDQVGLAGVGDKYPEEVSGGMRKRVAIARALVTEPEIVFFDEPTTGLDPVLVNTIHQLILDLHRRLRFTAVMVSHEIPEIFEIADRVGMLHEGRIVEVGPPASDPGLARTGSCGSSSAANRTPGPERYPEEERPWSGASTSRSGSSWSWASWHWGIFRLNSAACRSSAARGYVVSVDFPSVGGLKAGSSVEIAGVEIGRVESIGLADYQARVMLRLNRDIKLQEDSIASIKTKGLIGEKYVRISPGGSDKIIPPNGRIREVEAPVDFEELLSKYIFGKV